MNKNPARTILMVTSDVQMTGLGGIFPLPKHQLRYSVKNHLFCHC